MNATGTYDVAKSLLENAVAKGARRKVVIFTESRKTQDYLFRLLSDNGFDKQIVHQRNEHRRHEQAHLR